MGATPRYITGEGIMTTTDSTEKRMAEIRDRCEKASAGSWFTTEQNEIRLAKENTSLSNIICDVPLGGAGMVYARYTNDLDDKESANAEFIAASRTDIPFLLDQLQKYKRAVDMAREALDTAKAIINENYSEDCRQDEDCDHCYVVYHILDGPITKIDKILGEEEILK